MQNFRSYQVAKSLYLKCKQQPVSGNVRDQLNRASLSICLNLKTEADAVGAHVFKLHRSLG